MEMWGHVPERCANVSVVRVCARWVEASPSALASPTTKIQKVLPGLIPFFVKPSAGGDVWQGSVAHFVPHRTSLLFPRPPQAPLGLCSFSIKSL